MRRAIRFYLPSEYDEANRFFQSPESIEQVFGFEFSCGDGLFLSDIIDDDELLAKYDGEVDDSLIRMRDGTLISEKYTLSFTYNDEFRHTGADEFSKIKVMKGWR